MPNTTNPNERILIPSTYTWVAPFSFELQPIVELITDLVHGYELLYRGDKAVGWPDIDRAVLSYFAGRAQHLPRLFINLSNESILTIPSEVFLDAGRKNNLVFELSESLIDISSFNAVAAKVNKLSDDGLLFAIDDFGSGLDGLKRLYALKRVGLVKIDGDLLMTTMNRPDAAKAIQSLVSHWQASSIGIVAEGVETAEVLNFVRAMGVDLVQGWHVDAWVAKSVLLTA
jgi:EAL domain-containing protein (putative c-di-GMP-specific phosphodiesterase class I)